jgi:succinate dehydrogenase/fumarate reductase flavoprotein subunit
MATNIFLKGYQWPFDAQRINDSQSTMVDMAVHRETVQRGRRVFMDFLQNPVGTEGMNAFAIENLGQEARTYLERTGALQRLPIERLAHMNQPAIDIYAEHKIDLHSEPLEIAVCAQHQNGGFIVNKWWESTSAQTFIIGEMAGTHGVKRPGGSALNAGQAGALRSAEYIANVYGPDVPQPEQRLTESVVRQIDEFIRRLEGMRAAPHPNASAPREAIEEIRDRMTRHAAHVRDSQTIGAARREAETQFRRIQEEGFRIESRRDAVDAVVAESMALTQLAFLRALEDYIQRGGGSRGSYVILDPEGTPMPECLRDPETGRVPRWRPENEALRKTVQEIRFAPEEERLFKIDHVPVRPIPEKDIAFEPAWTAYREKKIFRE